MPDSTWMLHARISSQLLSLWRRLHLHTECVCTCCWHTFITVSCCMHNMEQWSYKLKVLSRKGLCTYRKGNLELCGRCSTVTGRTEDPQLVVLVHQCAEFWHFSILSIGGMFPLPRGLRPMVTMLWHKG